MDAVLEVLAVAQAGRVTRLAAQGFSKAMHVVDAHSLDGSSARGYTGRARDISTYGTFRDVFLLGKASGREESDRDRNSELHGGWRLNDI